MHSLARIFIGLRSLHRQEGSENEGCRPADCENWLPERGGETSRYDPGPPLTFKIVKHEAVGKSLPRDSLFVIAALVALVRLPHVEAAESSETDASAGHGSVWQYRHLVESARLAMVSKPA